MRGTGSRDSRDGLCFWSAEEVGPITVLRFRPDSIFAGVDLERSATLWRFFDRLMTSPRRVLLISIMPGELGHDAFVRFAEHFQKIPDDEYEGSACDPCVRMELARENNAIQRYIKHVRDSRVFVVGSYQGEIDMHLLGLLLACDFRIASKDSVIVSRAHPLSVSPATAAPWFLVRALGASRAMNVLLGCEDLPAQYAYEQGLFHRVTEPESHERDSLVITQAVAAKGTGHLLRLKEALAASALPLEKYLQTEGVGLQYLPVGTPYCVLCGYNLKANVSGWCPECGRLIDDVGHMR